eukprot:NODE_318_length_9930_cov_0.612857.p4 type:complete len:102 gc:universal NODE_318_length_9930_cov_0.612857:5007-5312(+)
MSRQSLADLTRWSIFTLKSAFHQSICIITQISNNHYNILIYQIQHCNLIWEWQKCISTLIGSRLFIMWSATKSMLRNWFFLIFCMGKIFCFFSNIFVYHFK